jgi:hypothetical protein
LTFCGNIDCEVGIRRLEGLIRFPSILPRQHIQ